MPNCEHNCCRDCAGKHFTIAIKDRNINEATCPFCMEPKGLAEDDDLAADRLKNAAATKKLAIMDAFEILNRIDSEEEELELNTTQTETKVGFAERRSR